MAEQIQVSKGNIYGMLGPESGISVSKSNIYAVIAPHVDIEVAKAVIYAIVVSRSLDFMPTFSRILTMQR